MNLTMTRSFACSFALHAGCIALAWGCVKAIVDKTAHEHSGCEFVIASFADLAPAAATETAPTVRMPNLPKWISKSIPKAEDDLSIEPSHSTVKRVVSALPKAPAGKDRSLRNAKLFGDKNPPSSKLVRINPEDFHFDGGGRAVMSPPSVEPSSHTDVQFVAELSDQLRKNFSGQEWAAAGFETKAEVKILRTGLLTFARLISSSGSAEFDGAVITAIQRVKLASVPATVADSLVTVSFRAADLNWGSSGSCFGAEV